MHHRPLPTRYICIQRVTELHTVCKYLQFSSTCGPSEGGPADVRVGVGGCFANVFREPGQSSSTGNTQARIGTSRTDHSRRDTCTNERLCERRMRIGRAGVECKDEAFATVFAVTSGQSPDPQFTRTRHPAARRRLDRTAGPLRGQRCQRRHTCGPDQRMSFLGHSDFGVQTALLDLRGNRPGPPLRIDDYRDAGISVRCNYLAGSSEQPAEIRDRGRHGFSREEGQLDHNRESRSDRRGRHRDTELGPRKVCPIYPRNVALGPRTDSSPGTGR